MLIKALLTANGLRYRVSELLGISPWRLRSRLIRYGLNDLDQGHIQDLARESDDFGNLPAHLIPQWSPSGIDLDKTLLKVESHLIDTALQQAGGSKTKAAELLGISLRTLQSRLSKISKIK